MPHRPAVDVGVLHAAHVLVDSGHAEVGAEDLQGRRDVGDFGCIGGFRDCGDGIRHGFGSLSRPGKYEEGGAEGALHPQDSRPA